MGENFDFRYFWKIYGIIIVFCAYYIFLSFTSDAFFTVRNQLNILRQISILGLISLGVFTTLKAGNVDLSVGSAIGFIGVVCAKVSLFYGTVGALVAAITVALAIGFLNGFFSTRGRNLSIMVTLSMKFILYSGTLVITRAVPIIGLPKSLIFLGHENIGPVPMPAVVLVLVALIFWIFHSYTAPGRIVSAVGVNETTASYFGISVKKVQIYTFLISAVCAALAGIVMLGRVKSGQPNAGFGMELDAVGAVLIGGTSLQGGVGTVRGVIFGVLILGLINNGLNLLGVDPLWRDAVKGAVILFAILMDQWERKQ
jgi:ribose/xylose/arabinose/galactoside ABC-type transport system permease subunit